MTQQFLQAATALADTLAAENRALAVLDFAGAVALLGAKQRATEAFVAAATPVDMRNQNAVATRLRELAVENKRLLERAVTVQGRVIGAIVRAIPKAVGAAPRYGAGGAFAGATRIRPIALSARA